MQQFALPTILAGQLILIAEDEPLIAFDVEDTICSAGAEVLVAANIEQAVVASARPDITAAVLDFWLGPHTVEPVCARFDLVGVPYIFTTGDGQFPEGRWDYVPILVKPFDATRLISTLTDVLVNGECRPNNLPFDLLFTHRCLARAEERLKRQSALISRLARTGADTFAAQALLNVMSRSVELTRDHHRVLARKQWMRH